MLIPTLTEAAVRKPFFHFFILSCLLFTTTTYVIACTTWQFRVVSRSLAAKLGLFFLALVALLVKDGRPWLVEKKRKSDRLPRPQPAKKLNLYNCNQVFFYPGVSEHCKIGFWKLQNVSENCLFKVFLSSSCLCQCSLFSRQNIYQCPYFK